MSTAHTTLHASTSRRSARATRTRARIATIAFIGAALFGSIKAQAAPALFSNVQARPSAAQTNALETYSVDIASAAVAADAASISIALPGRTPIQATRSGFVGDDSNGTWRGRITEGQDVVLTTMGGAVRGRIYTGDGSYSIKPDGEGGHTLSRVDTRELPHDRAIVPEIPHAVVPAPKSTSTTSTGSPQATVDVMVVFAAGVGDSIGGQAQLDLFAQAAIDQTNLVLENSLVDSFRVRLVKAAQVTRSGSGDPEADLPQVRQDAEIALMRAQAGADVVMFVGDYTQGYNGTAYKNTHPEEYGPVFASYAFAVVDRASVESSLVFVHELGHILGMDHDVLSPHDEPAENSFPFAYGHVAPRTEPYAQGVLTVMAYQGSCGGNAACQQVPYFSNSTIAPAAAPFEGRALGVLDQSENYRVAAIVGPITADFMAPDDILVSNFED